MGKSFFASIRCTRKTTNEQLDVTYNVLVGCYIPLCLNTLKGEPLDNVLVLSKLGPRETSNSGAKLAVLHAKIHMWGLGPPETCNSGPKVAVLHAKTTGEVGDP